MPSYVLRFDEIDRTKIAIAGGKAAHLAELSRIEGIRVPAGFCVTTHAFERIVATASSIDGPLDRLSRIGPNEREAIRALSAEIRRTLEGVAIPDDVAAAITGALGELGERASYAVRSSATAEDLPTASFAGQQDTYLNVLGPEAILRHVRRCWASLFTERAVTYRMRSGFEHRKVRMAVVVQRMVFPHSAGLMFTADPITGNRKVTSIEAVFGLGEALVSGVVSSDVYKVNDAELVAKTVAGKQIAVHASPEGGTEEHALAPERQGEPALTDAQVLRLAELGRRIEAHFGGPQDIEWCLVDDEFDIVQSRPITTLFPIPAAADSGNRVYVSVGHNQMMTDPMKPLGLSFWQMTTPAPMAEAGGRLFVDVTRNLANSASRTALLQLMGRTDPLLRDALETVLERGDFIRRLPEETPAGPLPGAASAPIDPDPALVAELIQRTEQSIAASKRDIETKSGVDLFDFIVADLQELKRHLFDPQGHRIIMTAMKATWWLNDHLQAWLGETNAADTLAQSVPHNVTSEMGLALLDVADAIRPHPEVLALLQHAQDDGFLDELPALAGGREARDAICGWLDRYGMRGVGEIDITRPRFGERPATLLPLLLSNIRSFEPGESKRRFEQGRLEASKNEEDLLKRLRALSDGERKAEEAKQMIDRVRTFIGYREYPKYGMIHRYFVYKRALLAEAERLVAARVLREKEDAFFLTFEELREVVRTKQVDDRIIRQRKDAFRSYEALTPPRVLTSDGEAISGARRREALPANALVGLAVSAGVVEGRARVILDIADANVEPGDILVTRYTDPSWTPLFVAVKGLVTEVGGTMTHGSVIAREYGLPAVVGVEHATRRIEDGQRIRVHGTDGYVEILP